MTRHTRRVVLAASLAFACAWPTAPAGQTPAASPGPGVTAKDAYPNGCVDCHVAGKDGDMRMSALMAKWTTAVPAALVAKAKAASVDASKIKGGTCHKKGSTIAPPFATLMHTIHLLGGSQNRFMTANQGACAHCHKLDQKTGAWKIASGPEK